MIGKVAKDASKEDALNYVAGYVNSNDVSCRHWQRDPKYAGNVPQWCFSKGFDKFAPIGAMIVSPAVITQPTGSFLSSMIMVLIGFIDPGSS